MLNVGTGIILGLLIGALAMLLADWFFYRDRRVCAEAEDELREANSLLISERDGLKRQVKSFDGQAARVGALESDLETRSKQYNLLLSDHEEAARRYRDLEARHKTNASEIANLQAALHARDSELNELNVGLEEMGIAAGGVGIMAALRSKFGEQDNDSQEIRAALEERDAEIASLQAELDARETEVGTLRGQVDGEMVNLRDTLGQREAELAELRADLDTREAEIGILRGQVESDMADLRDTVELRDLELAELQTELTAKDADLGEARAQLDELSIGLDEMGIAAGGAVGGAGLLTALRSKFGAQENNVSEMQLSLTEKDAEIASLRAELGTLRGALDVANVSLDETNADSLTVSTLYSKLGDTRNQLADRESRLSVNANDLENLRRTLSARELELGELRATLATQSAELNSLHGAIDLANVSLDETMGDSQEVTAFQTKLSDAREQLVERDIELGQLHATLAAQAAELSSLRGALDLANISLDETNNDSLAVNAFHTKLNDARGQLLDREVELGDLRTKLAAQSAELNSMRGALDLANVSLDETTSDSLEVTAFHAKLDDARTQLVEQETQLTTNAADLENLRITLATREAELSDLRGTMAVQSAELETLRGALDLANVSLDETTSDSLEVTAFHAKLDDARTQLVEQETQLTTNAADLEALRATLATREGELSDLRGTVAVQSAELDSLRGALDLANVSFETEGDATELATLRTRVSDLRGQLAERDAELAEINAEVNSFDVDWGKMGLAAGGVAAGGGLLARLRGLGSQVTTQESELPLELEEPTSEPIELNPYVIELQGAVSERDAELAALRAQWEAQSATLNNLRGELADLQGSQESDLDDLRLEVMMRDDDIEGLRSQLTERDAELGRIRAEASARSAELQRVNIELENRASIGAEIDSLRNTINNRDTEILSLRAQLDSVESELGDVNTSWLADSGTLGAGNVIVAMKTHIRDLEATVAQRDGEIIALQDSANKPDDLTKIWGIGKVIEGKLNESGIYTFEQLALTEREEIDDILATSSGRFRLATPAIRATWQEQARLAAVGDWDDLEHLQTRVRNEKPDQMTRIWGLDDAIERSLATRGIDTYHELEEVRYDEVLPELQMAQLNYPQYSKRQIYSYWVQQSRWAMDEDWEAVESQFAALETPPEPDDLTKIWGIGEGLEGILNANSIYTFDQLAEASEEQLDAIIERAGSRYRIATRNLHGTWSGQAEMAAADDWEALQIYQDKLSWSDEDSEQ